MGIDHVKSFVGGGWRVAAKSCDSCKLATAAVFCRADIAFLCLGCDATIHGANKLASRHERVWMCEVCEQAPAAVTCKADAAALCVTCDADIHSANPLSRRHERVPVEPFFDSGDSVSKSSAFNFLVVPNDNSNGSSHADASSWLIPNQDMVNSNMKSGGNMFFSDTDPFLDFEYSNSIETEIETNNSTGTDSVVPIQPQLTAAPVINRPNEICFDIDFCRSKLSSFSYPTQSLSQSVSSSSHDVGVVPDGNCLSDISYPFGRNMNNGVDPTFGGAATTIQPTQLSGLDREARVLRYREKRKNRKFEKTIRYASRKAYAETRPRIKGRFAKRKEIESDVDHLYDSVSLADSQYGLVVPSF